MSPFGQKLCGIHLGDEKFAFRGMPFGVPSYVIVFSQKCKIFILVLSAPAIYQSLNNVISTILRQYHVANCLYIGLPKIKFPFSNNKIQMTVPS